MNQRNLLMAFGIMILFMGIANAACTNPTASSIKIMGIQWGNSTHAMAVGPGSRDVPLSISMQSFGSTCALTSISGQMNLYGGISNFNGSQIAKVYVQSQNAYSIFDMVFHLNIADNISVGPNVSATYPLYISWNYTNNATSRATQLVYVNIPLKGSPKLSFSTSNPGLVAGQVNNITIKVSNVGSGAAYNIKIPISSSQAINFLNTANTISVINPGSTVNVSISAYVLPTLEGSQVTFDLAPYYIDPNGYNTSVSANLGFYVSQGQGGLKISASNATLYSGKINKVNVIISNAGQTTLSNLTVSFSPSSSISLMNSDGVAFINRLGPFSNVSIPLELYPSGSSTVGSVAVGLSYSGGSLSRTLSFLTPGYVNLSAVSFTVLPTAPTTGQIFSISATLYNLGSETAYATTVTPHPPKDLSIVGQNSTFIGDIASYAPTAFSISFRSSQNTQAGTYTIPVTLSYVNNVNQRLNQTLDYSVNIGNGNSTYTSSTFSKNNNVTRYGNNANGQSSPLVIGIGLLIAAGLAVFVYKKHSKQKSGKAK